MSGSSKEEVKPDSPLESTFIRFRLSHIESVTAWRDDQLYDVRNSPFSDSLKTVPIIRIYGATDQGQRVVAHVHGVFPYSYIEYKGSLEPDDVAIYIKKLARGLNAALHECYRRDISDSDPQYIAHIVLCKGIPFYGYHVGYKTYLKIYVTNKSYLKKMGEMLRKAVVMQTRFDVFEEHVGSILQFMLDSNLYGCGWVAVGVDCKMRFPLPKHEITINEEFEGARCTGPYATRIYDELTVPLANRHESDAVDRNKISYCALELDFSVESILNRHLVRPRLQQADFSEFQDPKSMEMNKLVHSVRELWNNEKIRRSRFGETGPSDETDPEMRLPREHDNRPAGSMFWNHERELWDQVEKLVGKDKKEFQDLKGLPKEPDIKTFVRESAKLANVNLKLLSEIRTTYEQVDAIYPSRKKLDDLARYPYGTWKLGDHLAYERTRSGSPEKAIPFDKEKLQEVKDEPEEEENLFNNVAGGNFESLGSSFPGAAFESEDSEEESDKEDFDLLEDLPVPAQTETEELPENGEEQVGEGPPLKRSKLTIASPSSPPVLAPSKGSKNPFHSSSTGPRHMMTSHPSLSENGNESETYNFLSSSQPEPADTETNEMLSLFDDLPCDAFSDYEPTQNPTATIRDPGPSTIPLHLRYSSNTSTQHSLPISNQGSIEKIEDGGDVAGDEASSSMVIDESPTSSIISVLSADRLPSSMASETKKTVKFNLPSDAAQDVDTSDTDTDSTLIPMMSQPSKSSNGSTDSALHNLARRSISSNSSDPNRQFPSHLPIAKNCFAYGIRPPSTVELLASLPPTEPEFVYKSPYWSNPADVNYSTSIGGEKRAFNKSYGGRNFSIIGDTIHYVKAFQFSSVGRMAMRPPGRPKHGIQNWEYGAAPPSFDSTVDWLANEVHNIVPTIKISSQIEGPTQVNGGFKIQTVKGAASAIEKQHLDILALELHVNNRPSVYSDGTVPAHDRLPDPAIDPIQAMFFCLQTDSESLFKNGRDEDSCRHIGIIAVGPENFSRKIGMKVEMVSTELEMIQLFLKKVRKWDPEICTGYEVHHSSWGYLLERAEAAYRNDLVIGDLVTQLGRLSNKKKKSNLPGQSSTPAFAGRHMLPIWRILKEDTKLCGYTFENVVFHLLRQRTPYFSHTVLTNWYNSDQPNQIARVFAYWKNRVEMDIEMIEEGEIVSQTCEFAQVFGVDFESVRTRGSQFKVESVMFRIAKPESFLLLSPSRNQVGEQNAAECTPLIMEPVAAFYKGPLLVLDFQSLYPSVMIAYNYCYSTCLGRIGEFKGTNKLGITNYTPSPGMLSLMEDKMHISPNRYMFVKANVRKSLLSKMLNELLDTRVMVKGSMKTESARNDKALLRLMNARQLGLKLLANVTYGYTSATFSGRMPCVEIADAIVQTGRETLEKAIETIKKTRAWGAEVVYGDTDSLFVYLPGKTKEDAFRIGQEIVDKVTSMNPRPIKLKFEKVYLPSVLLAKKKYVGFKYEYVTETEPEFDAKGIETVRRDGFPALQKMQEKCLKIMFRTSDLSQAKAYCQEQWTKMLLNNVSPQDFIFAKEVRMGSYSEKGKPPPGAAVSGRLMLQDRRAEPSYGERVPYLITIAARGTAQVHRAVTPAELLSDPRLRLDMEFYILKTIMPLTRIFNLMGADVLQWFRSMPKFGRLVKSDAPKNLNPVLLDEHFVSDRCHACDKQHTGLPGLCYRCEAFPSSTVYINSAKLRQIELKATALKRICAACCGTSNLDLVECASVDCEIYYSRKQLEKSSSGLVELE